MAVARGGLPVAKRVRLLAWRWGRFGFWTGQTTWRWRGSIFVVFWHPRAAALWPTLAFDDGAESWHAAWIEFDIECREVERRRFDYIDLAAAIDVARHYIDVAPT